MSRDISVHTFRHAVNGSVIHVDSGLCEDIDYDFFDFGDSPSITAKCTDTKGYDVIDEEKEGKKRKTNVKLTPCGDSKDSKSGKVIDQNSCNAKLTDFKNKTESSVQLSLADVSADNSRETDTNDLKKDSASSKEEKYMNLSDLMNCIAYSENKDKYNDDDNDHHIISKVHSVSPDFLSLSTDTASEITTHLSDLSVSSDTTTDITDVTPCPSSSGCSSMSRPEVGGHSMDKSHKDAERKQQKSDYPVEGSSGSSMKLLLNALDNFDRQKRKSVTSNLSSNQKNRLGRKNMSFSNEQCWKMERENKILLRKLQHLHKAQSKLPSSTTSQPRLPSSALNRRKQQAKIEHDNMVSTLV
jgi:hypothetical protein